MLRVFHLAALAALMALPEPAASQETFSYDAIGRLKSVKSQSGQVRDYSYDTADNVIDVVIRTASGSGAVWDRLTAGQDWLFSSNDRTVAYEGWSGSTVLGKPGQSTGDHEFSVTLQNPRTAQVGLSRSDTEGQGLGANADSIGMRHDGNVYGPGGWTVLTSLGAPTHNDTVTVRLKDGRVWFRKNGGAWNPGIANADPATGVGGLTAPAHSAQQPLFPAVFSEGDGPGNTSQSFAADFTRW